MSWLGLKLSIACALAGLFAATPVAAQTRESVTVSYAQPQGADSGYLSASVAVRVRLINCMGEIHLAYSVEPGIAVSSSYRFDGATVPATAAAASPTVIHFNGKVMDGPQLVGRFSDIYAAKALGMGCFTGQSQKLALLKDMLGPNPKPDQVQAYFNRLSVQPNPLPNAWRNGALEGELRAKARKAEGEKTAEAQRAAEEAARLRAARERQARKLAGLEASDADKAAAEREKLARRISEVSPPLDPPTAKPRRAAAAPASSPPASVAQRTQPDKMRPTASTGGGTPAPAPASQASVTAFAFCSVAVGRRPWTFYVSGPFPVLIDPGARLGFNAPDTAGILNLQYRTWFREAYPAQSVDVSPNCYTLGTEAMAVEARSREFTNGTVIPNDWRASFSDLRTGSRDRAPKPAANRFHYCYTSSVDLHRRVVTPVFESDPLTVDQIRAFAERVQSSYGFSINPYTERNCHGSERRVDVEASQGRVVRETPPIYGAPILMSWTP